MTTNSYIKNHFDNGIQRSKDLIVIYNHLNNKFPGGGDFTDLLRSSITICLSSFDNMVHHVLKSEIIYRLDKKQSISKVDVPIELFYLNNNDMMVELNTHLKKMLGYKSFMDPSKLAEGLSCIVSSPWDKIAAQFGEDSKLVKQKLRLICTQRNRIVHEADLNPDVFTPTTFPIFMNDVELSVNFISSLGHNLLKVIEIERSNL